MGLGSESGLEDDELAHAREAERAASDGAVRLGGDLGNGGGGGSAWPVSGSESRLGLEADHGPG